MKNMQSSSLRLERLNKSYGSLQVVNDVTLDVPAGSILTLLGPSGCGKTTVLRMIAGFANVSSGKVLVDGSDVSAMEPNFRDTGIVFQSYALFPHMTVAQNVAFGLRMRGISKAEQVSRVGEALEMVQLTHLAERHPSQLSGGQQQRVALARALVIRPKLLLLDEPLGALDRHLREGLQMELRTLQRRLGVTTILVTHDQEEALYLSDYIAVMNKGVIEQLGTPLEIYDRPRTEFVARFLGVPNIINADVLGIRQNEATISMLGVELQALPAGHVSAGKNAKISIRPSHINITTVDDPQPGLVGQVLMTKELGERTIYHVNVNGVTIEAHSSRMRSVSRHGEGSQVKLVLDPTHTIVLEG